VKRVPAKVTIDRKTGAATTEYVELTDEDYNKHVINPLAKILYEQMKRDIEAGKLVLGEYPDPPPDK
jgi:hypothetical protein